MNPTLIGTNFKGAGEDVIKKIFNNVVSLLSYSNSLMLAEARIPLKANEDIIRNFFVMKYVRLNKGKYGLGYMNFDMETSSVDPDSYKDLGYMDIKVTNINDTDLLGREDVYFTFECKRLNSHAKSTLENEYIKEGILRFVELKYSRTMNIGGMIGFMEKAKLNPETISANVNLVLTQKIFQTDNPITFYSHSYYI